MCKAMKWLKDFFVTKKEYGPTYMSECKKCNIKRRNESAAKQRQKEQTKERRKATRASYSGDPIKQAYQKLYYLKNKEKYREAYLRHREKNPEYYQRKAAEQTARRRQQRAETKESLTDKDCL